MQTYAYGHDFGNAETCGIMFVHGNKVSRSIPTAIAPGNSTRAWGVGVSPDPDYFVFKGQGKAIEQFIGRLALDQADSSSSHRGDISRYESELSLQMLLTVASSLIDDAEFGLNVVTGLPIETYLSDSDARRDIKKALEGTHTFSVNDRMRTIHVQVERVIMEGAGAAIAYGSRDKAIQGVIDVGGRTTDLFVTEGQKPLSHLCKGKALGVELAGDLLSNSFKSRYGRELKIVDIRRILRACANRTPMPSIVRHGHEVRDLADLAQEALKHVGDEIVSFICSQWSESESSNEVASSFSSVLMIGGGAYYFYEQLHERIPNLVFINSPEEANAYGYAVFAEQQLRPLRVTV